MGKTVVAVQLVVGPTANVDRNRVWIPFNGGDTILCNTNSTSHINHPNHLYESHLPQQHILEFSFHEEVGSTVILDHPYIVSSALVHEILLITRQIE